MENMESLKGRLHDRRRPKPIDAKRREELLLVAKEFASKLDKMTDGERRIVIRMADLLIPQTPLDEAEDA